MTRLSRDATIWARVEVTSIRSGVAPTGAIRLRRRNKKLDTTPLADIDPCIAAAIAAEREFLINAVGDALGQALDAESRTNKRALEAELKALRVEVHRVESLLEALRNATATDRSGEPLDLPALPVLRKVTVN